MTTPDKYPIGWRSAKTLEEILALREACTLRFPHGPHTYEVPGQDSLDPTMKQASREFVFAVHAAIPDMIRTIQSGAREDKLSKLIEAVEHSARFCFGATKESLLSAIAEAKR